MQKDRWYMNLAHELAKKGGKRVDPNPQVGAVIVKDEQIIATGYHHYFGGDHAEVDVLKKLNFKAEGAILYVTLEPCSHWGKTGPCVEVILRSGIKTVIIDKMDPNPIVEGFERLKGQGIEIREI